MLPRTSIVYVICLLLASTLALVGAQTATTSSSGATGSSAQSDQSQELAKKPTASIIAIISILREFFTDIDWETIEKARQQVELFIRRFDKLIRVLWPQERNSSKVQPGSADPLETEREQAGTTSASRNTMSTLLSYLSGGGGAYSHRDSSPAGEMAQVGQEHLHLGPSDSANSQPTSSNNQIQPALNTMKEVQMNANIAGMISSSSASSPSGQKANDSQASKSIREMLDRVACYVGYMRLLNESQQMIAELDAAKVMSNLFGAGGLHATNKKPGWWSSLFG